MVRFKFLLFIDRNSLLAIDRMLLRPEAQPELSLDPILIILGSEPIFNQLERSYTLARQLVPTVSSQFEFLHPLLLS